MNTRTEAAILCGGRGERLRPLTDFFQKAMVPIGPKKLPLLHYIIRLVSSHGIDNITLLAGYRSDEIKEYFGDGSSLAVNIRYSIDQKGVVGSLNAVAHALREGVIPRCEELLVYYGDVLSDLDITALLETHRKERADATLVLARGYTLPVGTAEVKDGTAVVAVSEKPRLELNVTTGCMVAGRRALDLMVERAGAERTDLMSHFVPELLRSGGKISGYFTDRTWYDVGTLASFEKLNSELGKPPLSGLAGLAPGRNA